MTPQTAEIDRDLPGLELVPLGSPFVVDSVGLDCRPGVAPSFAQWSGAAERLKKIHGAVKFWIGDLLQLGEGLFAEEASQVIDASYLTEQEVKAFLFVAGAVAPTTRAHAPSWDHARVVAGLKPESQVEWLDRARTADEPWSARKLATEIVKATADGKSVMRWWLVVECGTEARRDKLADELGPRGFTVKKQEKLRKVPKPKKAKNGPVTARAKRSTPKASTRRKK